MVNVKTRTKLVVVDFFTTKFVKLLPLSNPPTHTWMVESFLSFCFLYFMILTIRKDLKTRKPSAIKIHVESYTRHDICS